jgi:signal transduction histidine kinase
MSASQPPPTEDRPKSLLGRILYSDFAGKISQIPPFSWIARWLAYRFATRHIGKTMTPPKLRVYGSGLPGALDGIVRDVVEILGFSGAMVATFDNGEVLPVKALYVDPALATREQIRDWERQASELIGIRISLTDPKIARVHIYRKEDQENLGVKAAHARQYIISSELFDLFKTAIVPDSLREFIRGVQQALGIQQVITVPFFIKTTSVDGAIIMSTTTMQDSNKGEFVGNLFAAKRGEITPQDIRVLSTFAQYVASFILSERRRLQVEVIEKLILDIQKGLHSEEEVLQRIVKGVVDDLGYVGAMVATYNATEDVLPVRALYTGSNIDLTQIHAWEGQASDLIGTPLSLTDPTIAKVYLHQEPYKDNLSVKAAEKEKPVSSTDLFDLFITPAVPDSLRQFVKGIQEGLGIRRVIAVPFFLETTMEDGKLSKELIGNLFVASRSQEIQLWEIDILNAFGQQAAAGLRNVDLYQKAEDRRKAAEIFGKMAFTATASVHALKNHLGVVKGNLQLLKMLNHENEEMAIPALRRVDEMVTLVENLQEPWELKSDIYVDVNACIRRAAEKTVGIDIPWIKLNLTPNLPVKTLPEMLTEAFKVLIKNANEAMSSESIPEEARLLEIESRCVENTIEVSVEDHGTGIPPNDLGKIFEMKYTTKQSGLGFGLYWAKDYLEGLGGKITVESTLGQGTKFTVYLPLASDPNN